MPEETGSSFPGLDFKYDRAAVSVSSMGEFHGNQHTENEYADYTRSDLIADVEALADDLERVPTTKDAEADDRLPCLQRMYRLIHEDWMTVLRDAGLEPTKHQRRSSGRDRREQMLGDLRRTNRETGGTELTLRQYDDYGEFASSSIKSRFGSWSDACEAAGIDSGTKHGSQCLGPNGELLDSWHEKVVAEFLDDCDIDYDVHPRVGDTGYFADFYVPSIGLWIEVDGYATGTRPNERNFSEKVTYFEANGMDYVVVQSTDELVAELRKREIDLPS